MPTHDRVATRTQISEIAMPSYRLKFQYRRRSPFRVLLRITKYEIESIDSFVDLAKQGHKSQRAVLERLSAKKSDAPDDWLVDDFAHLDDFASLSAEFAIVGLWRCVELYRRSAIGVASGETYARQVFRHEKF